MSSEKEIFEQIPFLAENLVCLGLDAKWFWKKYFEIDFYHQNTLIEIKYTDAEPDIKNNLLAVKSLKSKKLLVITKNFEDKKTIQGVKIEFIPLWKYLLL